MNRRAVKHILVFSLFGPMLCHATCPGETGETLDFPNRGIRLVAPTGWQRTVGDQNKSVVSWISPDSTPMNVRALLKVEAGRRLDATTEAGARRLAANWGGAVSAKKLMLV